MHVEAFAGAHVERGEGAELLAHQMRVHGTGGENHWHRRARGIHVPIRQDEMGAALAHRVFRLGANARDGVAQAPLARSGIEAAIDLGRGGAHVIAHRGEFGVGQHR